jgi:hypothetical protein
MEGVLEVPITFFEDYPKHFRHAQLCACSADELIHTLEQARFRGFTTVVIILHSFELVWRGTRQGRPAVPRWVVVRRFERLCRFLDDHRDLYRTIGFRDIEPADLAHTPHGGPLRSNSFRTAARYAEQLIGRLSR